MGGSWLSEATSSIVQGLPIFFYKAFLTLSFWSAIINICSDDPVNTMDITLVSDITVHTDV